MNWESGLPSATAEMYSLNTNRPDLFDFSFRVRVKALHHWIRKGDPTKAAARAREVAHQVHAIWRSQGR